MVKKYRSRHQTDKKDRREGRKSRPNYTPLHLELETRKISRRIAEDIIIAVDRGHPIDQLPGLLAPRLYQPIFSKIEKSTAQHYPKIRANPDEFREFAWETIDSLNNLTKDYISAIVNRPGDLTFLKKEQDAARQKYDEGTLTKDAQEKLVRRLELRATGIVRRTYQNVAVNKARYAGVEYGIWIHSRGSKQPRKRHQRASGHIFSLQTMLFVTGPLKGEGAGFTDDDQIPCMPSEAYGCGCTFKIDLTYGKDEA